LNNAVQCQEQVTKTIAKIIRDDGRCLKNLPTDRGKKFFYGCAETLEEVQHQHYSTYSVMKASAVEWFNNMLKNNMWKQFTHNVKLQMNRHPIASRIKLQRAQASNYWSRRYPRDRDRFLITVYNRVKIAARYKVGDSVRVNKFKTVFDKGYTPNWTTHGGV